MEIINVEARTFEVMMTRFETFADRVDTLCRANGDKTMQQWLDTQEVCQILGIQSKRTIQTYRDNGTLPYSQIGYKMYYRPADVERLIHKLKSK
jgi:carbamoylphosphate synthase small subunit